MGWRRPRGGLWDHADFRRLWAGQSISELGSQVSQLAIPLLAASDLHASPIEFSLLGVAGFVPFILLALPAGAWVDRVRRRPVLIAGDGARALLMALIPILWAAGALRMWVLLAVQLAAGAFTVFFDVAYQSYLPALVEREQLIDCNAKLQLTVSVAQVAGPTLGGALVGALTAPYAIAADAISFVTSSAFVLRMRHRETPPAPRAPGGPGLLAELTEGVRFVLGHPWLRPLALNIALANLFSNVAWAILLLYLVRALHVSSLAIGLTLALGSCGAVAGALAVRRIQGLAGVGRTLVGTGILSALATVAYPLAPRGFPLPVLIAGLAASSFAVTVYNITQLSLRQAITPERLQGRMNAGMRWIVWGAIPVGGLAGGAIAQAGRSALQPVGRRRRLAHRGRPAPALTAARDLPDARAGRRARRPRGRSRGWSAAGWGAADR